MSAVFVSASRENDQKGELVSTDQTPDDVPEQLHERSGCVVKVIDGQNPGPATQDALQRIPHAIEELVACIRSDLPFFLHEGREAVDEFR